MSHLETALRRAIADLDPSDRDARRMALGNVRASMLRLLAVYDPPLSADAIERKIDEVDAYIRTIEAEFAAPVPEPAEPSPAPIPASSDFDEEYEAGDEDYVDEDPDEGPFDEDELEDEPLDEPEEAVLDLDETPLAPSEPSWLSARRLALIAVGLVALLAILIAGLYLAQRMAQGSATPAAVEEPATGDTPATAGPSAGGTDALESTDVPQDAAPSPAEPAPLPETAATPPADAAAPAAGEPSVPAATAPSTTPQAVAPPPGPQASESLMLFDGHDPSGFRSTPDNPVRFEGSASDGFVEISSSTGANGARLIVGPGVYQRIAGRNIRIVVVARGARDNPAATLRLAYQNGHQLSGWTDLDLGNDFKSLQMSWTVPKDRSGPDGDAILIEPGIPGDQTAADIRSVTIDVLP
ncbi:hypothetical protein LB518_10245 [Mesorhizobium sp. BR1-1-16]|uniref:hypothetical protein n=1 Tax=Mesorhizobium sp. BR1-1-16 TaxID=2876653 RepID=UPI001CCE191E|nr:hypothetical protein [Mesorhizobium sp. BR1-1-16]MBZ9936675.1 hypothetical protein [Mesorhizobium sp. BR1-1-16]